MSINDIESFIYSPPSGAINDLRYENLRSEGYYGSLNDMLYQKFRQKALNLVFDRLFINGEKGINKLDFSDFTGMYQDRARTVPYTAVEQPLGSFTGLNGVTATAPADVNRGVVSARVNIFSGTESPSSDGWVPALANVVGSTITADTSVGQHYIYTAQAPIVPGAAVVRFTARANGYPRIILREATNSGYFVVFDLIAGTVVNTQYFTGSITPSVILPGWFDCTVNLTDKSQFGERLAVVIGNSSTTNWVSAAFAGDGVSGVDVTRMQFVRATDAHLPYQWVNTATDYDTVGFPHYLAFNGTNTAYVTPSIDFTGTDKMTVWAGVTTTAGSPTGVIVESSGSAFSSNGAFALFAYSAGGFEFTSRGTILTDTVFNSSPPASPSTIAASFDIGGSSVVRRVNSQQSAITANQGTGQYGNHPLFIGARGGNAIYLNGRIYSLIVRGAQSSLSQIEATENLIRQKMRLP